MMAMNKIPFSRKYSDFFKSTMDERHVFIQGGRRSGKTFATFLHLFILSSLIVNSGEASELTIMVFCSQYSQLQSTMIDFEKCIGVRVTGSKTLGDNARTCNGRVVWQFKAFDNPQKVQGTQCDYSFFNEAVNIPEDIARVQMMSTRRQCFYNYNPTRKFWGEQYFNGSNLLCTTFKDNDFLTDEQREEFENIREKALKPTARKLDIYQYNVYYLGEFSNVAGNVFGTVNRCTLKDYCNVPAQEVIGIDFGFSTDGDPTTCIGVKRHDNKIYIHQYFYEKGLTSNIELANKLVACGFNSYTLLLADYGGMGRSRIDSLRTADNGQWVGDIADGFNICPCIKTAILDGLSAMLTMDSIVITDCSTSTIEEFELYELDEHGKPKGSDHSIDAARYAFTYINKVL